MELFLHQVLAGLATGGIYACMALAVVMIYQAIDHLNFAQGEMAMFSTFIAWQLMQWGFPYWLAFGATIVISFAAGVMIERVVLKPLHEAPVLSHVVAFIALLAIINSGAGFIWDWTIKSVASPFGSGQFLGQNLINKHDAGMIGVTILMLVLLYLFFAHTRIGLALRAAAANPESARLAGIRVGWMTALGWGMAAAIGSVAGMLISPLSSSGAEPNGEGNGLMVNSQIQPATLLKMANSAMNTAICANSGSLDSGLNTIRSISIPPIKETMIVAANAPQ